MRIKFYPACFIVVFLFLCAKGFSQTSSGPWGTLTERPNTPINEMFNGYIEVLPPAYDPNGLTRYPLIIFLEGQSQFGNGSTSELQSLYGLNEGMLPDIVRKDGLPNQTYQFIILIPQARRQIQTGRALAEQMASPSEVNDIINYALQNYKVDVNRVYLSGLSLGGGSTWNYAGQSVEYANRLAAIVPFSGASSVNDNPLRDDNIALANLPVWTFVNGPHLTELDPNSHQPLDQDSTYRRLAQEYINAINTHAPSSDALITIYPTGDHNSWKTPLEGGNTLVGGNTGGTSNPSNIYTWMLSKSRSLSQPVFATINAGSDQTLNLPDGSMVAGSNSISFTGATVTLNGSETAAPGRTIVSRLWVRVNGNGGTITSPNSLSTTVTDLKPGDYTYQLRVTDDQGLTSVDNVYITVNKPADYKYYKIEAEDYNAASGPQIERSYLDEGPAYGLGFLGNGNSMTYNVNVAHAGTYDLYYRYVTFGAQPIQIVVNGATYNATLSGATPGSWTTSKISVSLNTTNTIQFISQGNSWQNFNYFELALTSSLPVKFVYFNAQCKEGTVGLEWKTAEELNSQRFSVQRSGNGVSWSEVGSVAAAGQSNGERSYSFVDKTASGSVSMYRIVEYDFNGQQTISSIVRSSCATRKDIVSVYPNPTSANSTLSFSLEREANVTIRVVDSKGAIVQQREVLLPPGTTTVPLNLESHASGVYSIQVQYNGETKTLKLIKK